MHSSEEAPRAATRRGRRGAPSRGSPGGLPSPSAPALLVWAAAVLLVGCSGTDAFHRHYLRADYRQAEHLFLADSALREDPRAVYRAGLMYADPASPIRDPERARQQFEALLDLDPAPDHVHAGRILVRLGDRADSLETRVGDLRRDNEMLGTRIDLMREAFGDFFSTQAVQIDSLRSVADSLRGRLRRVTRELSSVEEKLERFREVDLEGGNDDGG